MSAILLVFLLDDDEDQCERETNEGRFFGNQVTSEIVFQSLHLDNVHPDVKSELSP